MKHHIRLIANAVKSKQKDGLPTVAITMQEKQRKILVLIDFLLIKNSLKPIFFVVFLHELFCRFFSLTTGKKKHDIG
jgi:hypothetical protein